MLLTWCSAVLGVMTNRWAMAGLDKPLARRGNHLSLPWAQHIQHGGRRRSHGHHPPLCFEEFSSQRRLGGAQALVDAERHLGVDDRFRRSVARISAGKFKMKRRLQQRIAVTKRCEASCEAPGGHLVFLPRHSHLAQGQSGLGSDRSHLSCSPPLAATAERLSQRR